MTTSEQRTINDLNKTVNDLISENRKYREGIDYKIETVDKRIEQKHLPYNLVLLNKIAKTVISGIDGSIDKTINLMKQDAIFRSRLTLSVNGLVNEFLNNQKS